MKIKSCLIKFKSWLENLNKNMTDNFRLRKFQKKWRKRNKHNFTMPVNVFDMDIVTIGKASYADLKIISPNNMNKIYIGNYCSTAGEVVFLINEEHRTNTVSTYPFKIMSLKTTDKEAMSKGDIVIDDDVWIGYRATIMSGVHIGQGAIIGAGALVTKDVPPYAIVGGVPAKIIKYRFSEEIISVLMQIDFSKFDDNFVKENVDVLYKEINTVEDAEMVLEKYNSYKVCHEKD